MWRLSATLAFLAVLTASALLPLRRRVRREAMVQRRGQVPYAEEVYFYRRMIAKSLSNRVKVSSIGTTEERRVSGSPLPSGATRSWPIWPTTRRDWHEGCGSGGPRRAASPMHEELIMSTSQMRTPTITKTATKAPHPRKLFVNIPVSDVQRSIVFFEALDFSFNPQFTDATATCMLVGEDAYFMLLNRAKFAAFSKRPPVIHSGRQTPCSRSPLTAGPRLTPW